MEYTYNKKILTIFIEKLYNYRYIKEQKKNNLMMEKRGI